MSTSARKPPNIWVLASVTYGAVIAVTILSILAYYYVAPKRPEAQSTDTARSLAVGSVWIPVYPNATVEGTVSEKRGSGTESTLNFETRDQADRVLSFYQSALKKGVFRFDTVTKHADGGTIRSVLHGGKTTVVVTIRATGDSTRGEILTIDKDIRN
ncbi:MAG: hypothetical protein JWO19_5334 [Bryobacterales bacterium]|jgi:hypothetical protein|nr:hypothetical protein [Bryobacterales bacterium]